MFFRCHCTGPGSSWNLALLAHIYAKVAICKSCEGSRRRQSTKRLSPENPRFGAITASSSGADMIWVAAGYPVEIKSSEGSGRPGTPLPRFPIKYPPKMGPSSHFWQHHRSHLSSNLDLRTPLYRTTGKRDCPVHTQGALLVTWQ
jgi:hypothetical protein